ncbi:MAG: hypothetical protein JRJ87_09125 [Deltaproteobacteria bacterium]|nr:hypothetical protein [Deltaproteobacteria bacterium]
MSTRSKFRAMLGLVGILALTCSACEFDVGTVDIKLVYSNDADKDPLHGILVKSLRITITGDDMETIVEEFDNTSARGGLSGVPLGKNRVVTVEGIKRDGTVHSRGISAPFETVAGTIKIYVFMSNVETFLTLSAFGTDDEWKDTYKLTMDPNPKRAFHTSTLLPNGEVLVAGGRFSFDGVDFIGRVEGEALQSIARFDGYSGGFFNEVDSCDCQTGLLCMRADRAFHTADLLPSGEYVLFVGGEPADASFSAEVYEISSKTFIPAENLIKPRSWHCSVVSSDQGVLIAGGIENISFDLSQSVELYTQGRFEYEWPSLLSQARLGSVEVTYPGGLLIIGGWEQWGEPGLRQASSTIDKIVFNGNTPEVSSFNLGHARADHTAVLLKDTDGPQILVCGGHSDDTSIVSTCEIIDVRWRFHQNRFGVAGQPEGSVTHIPKWPA